MVNGFSDGRGGCGGYVEGVDLGCFASFHELDTTADGASHGESVLAEES